MRGFAPRKHPAPGLQPGMHRKTTFCFSANTCWQTVTPGISRQPANAFPVTSGQHLSGLILYRALHFQVITTSLPAPAGNSLSPHIFSYQPTQPHASPQPPFRLDRPTHFFYRAKLSLPVANIITSFANHCRQNSKPICKNSSKKSNKKRKPKLP